MRGKRPLLCLSLYALCISFTHTLYLAFYVDYFLRKQIPLSLGSRAVGSDAAAHVALDNTTVLAEERANHTGRIVDQSTSGGGNGGKTGATSSSLLSHMLGSLLLCQLLLAAWHVLRASGIVWSVSEFRVNAAAPRLEKYGPLWAVCFIVLWLPALPFLHVGVVFTILMAIYELLFSYCVSSFQILWSESSFTAGEKKRSGTVMLLVQCIGSVGAGIGSLLYESSSGHGTRDGLWPYRVFCVVTALLLSVCFCVVRLPKEQLLLPREAPGSPMASVPSFWGFVQQTMARPSMRCVSVVFAIQEYSSTFATTFFSLFLAVVTADLLPFPVRACLLLLSFILPHLLVALDPHLLFFFETKKVILGCFILRAAVGFAVVVIAALMSGGLLPAPLYVAAFTVLLLVNRVLTEVVNALKNQILNDLADEDIVVFGRNASTIDALRSLMSSIANICRPLSLALTFISLAYYDIFSLQSFTELKVAQESRVGIVRLVGCGATIPSVVMAVMWWYMYPLEGKYLQFISSAIKKRTDVQNANSV